MTEGPGGGEILAEPAAALERICAAAEAEFRGHGFHATTMDAVARAAGCSKKTIYKLFDSKEALFFRLLDRFKDRAQRIEVDPGLPPQAALEGFLWRIGRLILDEEAVSTLRMVLGEYRLSPSLLQAAERHFGGGILALDAYLARLEAEGLYRFGAPAEAARMLMGMALGAYHHERLIGLLPGVPEAALRTRIQKAVTIFLAGTRLPPRPAAC
ncbi:TetR/AcrR family transcriptional regulator [Teichococcus oryzae]|uniref:TetR/AcrR family transcriptional regulator n=1 Tax=Teichococcus oryzae TaxID=1608942 RepID=UPI001375D583|nr:TetR/AcrR family transcriptional regulator [Pseudoroseomonas oryzae]